MRTKKILALTLVLSLSTILTSCLWYEKREIEKEGNLVIEKIEKFRKANGRLPYDLTEAGDSLDKEGPFSYSQKSSTRYTLSTFFDGNRLYEYDSETRKWEEKPK